MDSIVFLAHTEAGGELGKAALTALGAAKKLADEGGADLSVALFGAEIQEGANQIASCGASKFLGVSGAEFGAPRYGSDTAAAEALCKASGAGIVVAPATSRCSRILAGVAHRLGGRADTHATDVCVADGAVTVKRWYYRQRMEATIQRSQRPWVISVDAGSVQPWEGEAGSAQVEAVAIELTDACKRTNVTGVQAPSEGEQTIRPDADLLFVAGAGWTKAQSGGAARVEDAEKLIRGFLSQSQASLGSSKSLVDMGTEGQAVLTFMSHLNQVGQTGSTPRHPKGLSTCCHGEEPHAVGWRFINERRAINLDANCGWAQGKADVVYVADAFEVMEKVNELLAKG